MDAAPASTPAQTGRGRDGAQALRPDEMTAAAGDVSQAHEPSTSGNGELVYLFERARLALASRLQLGPEIADALVLPRPGWSGVVPGETTPAPSGRPGTTGRLAAQLAVDDRTRQIVVRVIDTRTGDAVREFPPGALAALAAKIGRVVTDGTQR